MERSDSHKEVSELVLVQEGSTAWLRTQTCDSSEKISFCHKSVKELQMGTTPNKDNGCGLIFESPLKRTLKSSDPLTR